MAKIKFRETVRWLVLLSSLVLAFLFLNSALFSGWNAGGPPNAYREAWEHRSLTHLGYAGAFLAGGIGLFGFGRSFPRVGIVSIGLLFIAGIFALLPHGKAFLAQDSCLDRGGKWLPSEYRCET